jgi:hypothetical protein
METATALPGLAQILAIYGDLSLNLADGWQAISPFYFGLPALVFTPFALIAIFFWKPISNGSLTHSLIRSFAASLPRLFLSLILFLTTIEMILVISPDRRDDKYLFMLLPVLSLLGAQGMVMMGQQLLVVSHWWSVKSSVNSSQTLVNSHQPPSSIIYLLSVIFPLLVAGLILILTQPAIRAILANPGDDYASAFAYVRANWQPDDKIFSGTPAAAAFYLGRNDFYGVQRRGGYDYRLLTVNGQTVDRWLASPAIRTEAELHQTLAQHDVWLVLERWGLQREYYDLVFLQQLLAQTDPISQSQGIFILHSKDNPQPLALNPAFPVEANFNGLIRLTGYTIEPLSPTPGQSLRLTLYWQPLAPLPHDYTVFVHLRHPGGENVTQSDHRPLENLYPTSLWPVDEIIRESSQLNLPANLPPGEYELWVGLYRLETGERLPVQNDTSGENAVNLGRVVVSGE